MTDLDVERPRTERKSRIRLLQITFAGRLPVEKWTLCLIGKRKVIDFLSRIAIDLKRIPCAHGLANQKVSATTGGVGESKMEAHQVRLRQVGEVGIGVREKNA